MSFDFISELQAKLGDNYLKHTSREDKSKPQYLCTYYAPKPKRFYLYVGIGNSCAVYAKSLEECGSLTNPATPEKPQSHKEVDEFIKKIEDEKVKDQ